MSLAKSAASSLFRGAWDAVWPARCPLCNDLLSGFSRQGLCQACQETVRVINNPLCKICGMPFLEGSEPASLMCGYCQKKSPAFDVARAYGRYKGALAQAIKDFKFRNARTLLPALADMLIKADQRSLSVREVDRVIPVPLHPKKLREREFNQAADLAKPLAGKRGAPLELANLVTTRPTEHQAGLSINQRRMNVRGAFKLKKPDKVKDARVMLVDDVLTTGATANECAKVLKKAGASQVLVITVARTP